MATAGIKTAELPQLLTADEQKTLDALLAKAGAAAIESPATRLGDPYIALINLSVPRRSGNREQNDLVMAGETVNLYPHEAEQYMRHGTKDGRRVAVIRPASGPGSSQLQPQRVPPIAVSGRLQGPPIDARPDPAGSSAFQVIETATVPESFDPRPGQENWDGDPGAGGHEVNAEDIIPSRVRARQAPRG